MSDIKLINLFGVAVLITFLIYSFFLYLRIDGEVVKYSSMIQEMRRVIFFIIFSNIMIFYYVWYKEEINKKSGIVNLAATYCKQKKFQRILVFIYGFVFVSLALILNVFAKRGM